MAESKVRIPEDDFVAKVVKDPKQPPDTLLLTGFLGKSSEEGHARLYFDPELKNYVEIPHDAIRHWQEIPKETSPLGGYHVWIDPNAELIHGRTGPQRTKAKFFEGPIGTAAAAMAGGPVAFHPSPLPIQCGATVLPACHTHFQLQCAPSPLPHICPQTIFAPCIPHSVPIIACVGQPGGVIDPGVQAFHAAAPATGVSLCRTVHPICPAPSNNCPATSPPHCPATLNPNCPTFRQGCPSHDWHCPSVVCPVTQGCPTQAGAICTAAAPCNNPFAPTGDFIQGCTGFPCR